MAFWDPFFETPGQSISDYASEQASSQRENIAAEAVESVADSNRHAYYKASLIDVVPMASTTPAHIALWRYRKREDGGIVEEPVKAGDQEVRKYEFIVTNLQRPQQERFMIMQTFGDDPDFVMTFGKEPYMWNLGGIMRNEYGKGNWVKEFDNFYRSRLRASLLVERGEFIVLRVGKLRIKGYLTSLVIQEDSTHDDVMAAFNMQMYVRDYSFVENGVRGYAPITESDL